MPLPWRLPNATEESKNASRSAIGCRRWSLYLQTFSGHTHRDEALISIVAGHVESTGGRTRRVRSKAEFGVERFAATQCDGQVDAHTALSRREEGPGPSPTEFTTSPAPPVFVTVTTAVDCDRTVTDPKFTLSGPTLTFGGWTPQRLLAISANLLGP